MGVSENSLEIGDVGHTGHMEPKVMEVWRFGSDDFSMQLGDS